MTVTAFRYRAFISYSHRDQAAARWLHGALESYRVPSRLIGKVTGTGEITKRLGAIFRDRDELPVASDLTGKINEALAAAQFLIVLCSPAAAQSKWVNQEVINFKRIKGEDSIIAVIVDGEPYASSIPGREAEECFVPALRFRTDAEGRLTDHAAEPIAADMRPGKDSKRLVKLKVLAGLLGLGLDELARRETQRRQRRMFWVSTGSVAAMVMMGVLTLNAVTARNDAERQKAQAENLIEFMLGDLRKKLQPVGRLDVLDSVGERALQYFDTLKPDELDADTLGRKSRALNLLGEIESTRGNLNNARKIFAEAKETTEVLLARDPENPQRIFDQAQSVFWLGNIDWQRGDKVQAEAAFNEYQRLSLLLIEKDPKNTKWLAEAAYSYNNVGVMLFQDRRFKDASEQFQRGRTIQAKLVEAENKDLSRLIDLGRFDAWLADSARLSDDLTAAAEIRAREIVTYQRVLDLDPLNKSAVEFYVPALIALGRIHMERGSIAEAEAVLRNTKAQAEKLAAGDPENGTWQELYARTEILYGDAQLGLGEQEQSEKSAVNAIRIADELLKRDASVIRWKVGLKLSAQALRAKIKLHNKDLGAANTLAAATVSELREILKVQPKRNDVLLLIGQTELVRGDSLRALKQEAAAKECWEAGLQAMLSIGASATLSEKLTTAILMDRTGRAAESQKLASVLYDSGQRRSELLELIRNNTTASSNTLGVK